MAATNRRAPRSAGFVNAVLRRFGREREAIVAAALADPLARFNHPAWWLERLRADWPERWQAIADADNLHPPMTLRVNARRGDARRRMWPRWRHAASMRASSAGRRSRSPGRCR